MRAMQMGYWQFQLRDLFVAVTLLAALSGIVVCAAKSGRCGPSFQTVDSLSVSPDGRSLLVASQSGRYSLFALHPWQRESILNVSLVNLEERTTNVLECRPMPHYLPFGPRPAYAFDPSGNVICLLEHGGLMYRWDLKSHQLFETDVYVPIGASYWFARSGKQIVVAEGNRFQVIDTSNGQRIGGWNGPLSAACRAILPQNDENVAVGYLERIEIRNATTGELLRSWVQDSEHTAVRVGDLTRDGTKLVVLRHNAVCIHNLQSEEVVQLLKQRSESNLVEDGVDMSSRFADGTLDVAFSPDGRRVALVGAYGVTLYDAVTGELACPALSDQWANHVVFTSDGRRIITSTGHGEIDVWDSRSGRAVMRIEIPGHIRVPWPVPLTLFIGWSVVAVLYWKRRSRRVGSALP